MTLVSVLVHFFQRSKIRDQDGQRHRRNGMRTDKFVPKYMRGSDQANQSNCSIYTCIHEVHLLWYPLTCYFIVIVPQTFSPVKSLTIKSNFKMSACFDCGTLYIRMATRNEVENITVMQTFSKAINFSKKLLFSTFFWNLLFLTGKKKPQHEPFSKPINVL